MGTTNFDQVDSIAGYKYNGTQFPVEAYTIKTVGAGMDFERLHDALKWAEKTAAIGPGAIALRLSDGVHYIGEPDEFNTEYWSYYAFTCQDLQISSQSGDKSACTVTFPATDDGENWPNVFTTVNSNLYVSGITFDLASAGFPNPQTVSTFVLRGGRTRLHNINMTGGYNGVTVSHGGSVEIYGYQSTMVFDGQDTAISAYTGSHVTVSPNSTGGQLTVQNAVTTGLHAQNAIITASETGRLLFGAGGDANTADTNITLNEIQYNGSYISNATAALTLKA